MADSHPDRDDVDDLFAEVLARLDSGSRAPGEDADPRVSLDSEPEGESWPVGEELARLSAGVSERYRFLGEIGRGGMGVVLKVWDRRLRRVQALKLSHRGPGSSTRERTVARFLEEAQVAAQLDHPGILPVHDLGALPDGQVYFTMQLVRGERLTDVYERVWRGDAEWTLARAVGVLLQVAEAMAYAHGKGVVHRDLKPSNVMVGRFGEVHVLDWGLAKVRGRDTDDAAPDPEASDRVSTFREETDASPALTQDGTVVGTPAYMSPEQAGGGAVDERTDVYAMGAMLYHLLARAAPYADAGEGLRLWQRIAAGPPDPIERLAPGAPADLAAVAEHAMARDPAERYPDVSALARDLRAWLEGRVVGVHDTGLWTQLRKWVARNRALAAATAAAGLALVAGTAVSTALFLRAEARATDVLRLSALRDHAELVDRSRALWPPGPEIADACRAWVADARDLVALLPELEDKLDELAARELPVDTAELDRLRAAHPAWADLEQVRREVREAEELLAAVERDGAQPSRNAQAAAAWLPGARTILAELEAEVEGSLPRRFAVRSDGWWYDQVAALVADLRALDDPETGLLRGVHPELGPGVARRLEWAGKLGERTHDGAEARRRWSQATASIADPEDCPAYGGLAIEPQLGLLPLARNPVTGLWEFWHVLSGDEPEPGPDGHPRVGDATGVVFVLLPGGPTTIGAELADGSSPRHDPYANPGEGPPVEVRLDPFFVSKYELTQGQWARLTGDRPSVFQAGSTGTLIRHVVTDANPVESVDWVRASEVAGWYGFELPTEAQWEHAARAGTPWPWWTGPQSTDLDGAENLSDATAARAGATWGPADPTLDDGFLAHAPVGTFRANPYGLFDVLGNVRELCRDRIGDFAGNPPRDGDGLRVVGPTTANRMTRGGAFAAHPRSARVTQRVAENPSTSFVYTGVRPVRRLEGAWTSGR